MTTTVKIKGMSCNHCVMAVDQALRQISDVKEVKVVLDEGKAIIEHDKSVDMNKIKEVVEKAGYEIG